MSEKAYRVRGEALAVARRMIDRGGYQASRFKELLDGNSYLKEALQALCDVPAVAYHERDMQADVNVTQAQDSVT